MSTSKSTQSRLLALGGQDAPQLQAPPADFIRKMLHHPDPKEAAQIIAEQAGLEFDQGQGSAITQLKLEQQDLETLYKVSKDRSEQLAEKIKGTKQFIKSGALHSGSDQPVIGFFGWRRQDQISIVVIALALITAMVMGAANVYANLMASGQPVFIEKPWLAVSLSMLVPAGSAALKFISSFFEYSVTKKRYALCIYTLTTLVLLAWSVSFALNFTGVAGGIDWESLGESSGKGALLVWTQLCAEILVAAALFLAAEDIYLKYAPDTYVENVDFINAQNACKKHLAEHERLRDVRNANHARLVALNAARQAFINERIAEYCVLRSRFNALNNF